MSLTATSSCPQKLLNETETNSTDLAVLPGCIWVNTGPRCIPSDVKITIDGIQLSRPEMVARATQILKTRNGFENMFSGDIQIRLGQRKEAKFRYVVKFTVFH